MAVLKHGSEAWTTVEKHKSKITRCDHIRNDTFRTNLNKIQEGGLEWTKEEQPEHMRQEECRGQKDGFKEKNIRWERIKNL